MAYRVLLDQQALSLAGLSHHSDHNATLSCSPAPPKSYSNSPCGRTSLRTELYIGGVVALELVYQHSTSREACCSGATSGSYTSRRKPEDIPVLSEVAYYRGKTGPGGGRRHALGSEYNIIATVAVQCLRGIDERC